MSALSGPAAASILSLIFATTALPAQTSLSAPSADVSSASGLSKVRIVRLSEARGAVQMDRGTGRGFEAAMQNLPIVEASQVETGIGVAEIEFEDNSTVRLAPNTAVEFPLLERRASGATVTAVRVLRGMAYVSLTKSPAASEEFTLLFGPEKLPLAPDSHIRLEMKAAGATVAVLGGSVEVNGVAMNGADGAMAVPSKRSITFAFAPNSEPVAAKGITPNALDSWDKQSTDYHARAASLTAFGNAPYSYGMNDMGYYGSFTDAGDCGMMWRPYFASAAWDPYGNGTWAWYPGAGYSWVSPYPWGWMPYHYGGWSYCPGAGWGWMPGGAWNGIANVPANLPLSGHIVGMGSNPRFPHPPTQPPRPGESTLTDVNLRPLVLSEVRNGAFVFRRDSAGLGIPREGLGDLRGLSHDAVRRGMASTPVYFTVGSRAEAPRVAGRTTAQELAPVTIHRGSAPAPAFSSEPVFTSPGGSHSQSTVSLGTSNHMGGAAPAGGGGGAHTH
ncbi:MAG: DUF6600 domain-containing protein [Acidobacteriaceae bacterium]